MTCRAYLNQTVAYFKLPLPTSNFILDPRLWAQHRHQQQHHHPKNNIEQQRRRRKQHPHQQLWTITITAPQTTDYCKHHHHHRRNRHPRTQYHSTSSIPISSMLHNIFCFCLTKPDSRTGCWVRAWCSKDACSHTRIQSLQSFFSPTL